MAIKTCLFCTENFPKSEGAFTRCCHKRIHLVCTLSLNKCPYCRVEPLIVERVGEVKRDDPTIQVEIEKYFEAIFEGYYKELLIMSNKLRDCYCRGQCKHEKCKCTKHNHNEQYKYLENISKIINTKEEILYSLPFSCRLGEIRRRTYKNSLLGSMEIKYILPDELVGYNREYIKNNIDNLRNRASNQ